MKKRSINKLSLNKLTISELGKSNISGGNSINFTYNVDCQSAMVFCDPHDKTVTIVTTKIHSEIG